MGIDRYMTTEATRGCSQESVLSTLPLSILINPLLRYLQNLPKHAQAYVDNERRWFHWHSRVWTSYCRNWIQLPCDFRIPIYLFGRRYKEHRENHKKNQKNVWPHLLRSFTPIIEKHNRVLEVEFTFRIKTRYGRSSYEQCLKLYCVGS